MSRKFQPVINIKDPLHWKTSKFHRSWNITFTLPTLKAQEII